MAFKYSKSHLPTSSLWLAKVALLPLLLLLAARLLVPLATHVAATTLPALRTHLATPYLFVTINFIILTIWKLSEKGHPQPSEPMCHKPKQVVSLSQTKQEEPPTWSPPPPALTEEHDPPHPVEPPPRPEPVAPLTPPEEENQSEEEEEEEEEALSMDDTWRKITRGMKRSETFTERRLPEVVEVKKWETLRERREGEGEAASRVELQMGQDDLNRRYEALIRRMKNEAPPPQKLRY